ncbi:MAG: hypothetical protein JNM63_11025, partial [Spirochaetia bacterium]|nr:hypothetical protein [Spirochaetia bacterium]
MQNLFLAILVTLTIFTQIIIYRDGFRSGEKSGLPVLYWVTDANPVRQEQVRLFRQWLTNNRYPDMEIRLDTANRG